MLPGACPRGAVREPQAGGRGEEGFRPDPGIGVAPAFEADGRWSVGFKQGAVGTVGIEVSPSHSRVEMNMFGCVPGR